MVLRLIARGTHLEISMPSGQDSEAVRYNATFYDMHDLVRETSFIVQCAELYKNFSNLNRDTVMEISFSQGPNIYTLTGRVASKMRSDLVIIEQLTDIETFNRRIYQRDEILVEVRVYGLPEELVAGPRYRPPESKPVMSDVSFDVSSGGMCILSNTVLTSEYDPYYLLEFSFSDKDWFLLPAKLVRRSKLSRSSVGRNDYGFKFIFDAIPDEKARLTKTILAKKLALLR